MPLEVTRNAGTVKNAEAVYDFCRHNGEWKQFVNNVESAYGNDTQNNRLKPLEVTISDITAKKRRGGVWLWHRL